ncbi:response regulator [Geoalkalibacter halelectricus]|uniref:Response regulator n=1 Tax=Geoalkalibacter halelectricus TaxID=2847045 RepID=A0ABY5ZHT7_9BACT|nr:response regulator [Geoalkalibacter halelectricus]MDO3377726.1 response regulator [Geoalkalibacter halelectricus]UWZ78676.1 response regulator [Geoalkalibacter halelectricus]
MSRRKRFGEILVEAGIIDEASLQKALDRQKGSGRRLGRVLEELGVVTEKDIAVTLSRQFGFKTVSGLAKYNFPSEVLALIDGSQALEKLIFPLKKQDKTLFLAMVNPLDMETLDNLAFRTGFKIVSCVTTPSEIQAAVDKFYLAAKQEQASDWWTILIVEDQELARAAAAAALRKHGYTVVEAENGAEGLKQAHQHKPHLIIADTIMPRMDGYEMFRALKSNPATAKIPVIAMSSKSSAEEEAQVLDMGYLDFIAKPINPVRLAARSRRALRLTYGEGDPPRRT